MRPDPRIQRTSDVLSDPQRLRERRQMTRRLADALLDDDTSYAAQVARSMVDRHVDDIAQLLEAAMYDIAGNVDPDDAVAIKRRYAAARAALRGK